MGSEEKTGFIEVRIGRLRSMSYTWLKRFDIDIAEAYPYIKVFLSISPIWKYPAPFYTFVVKLKVGPHELGHYLYIGEYVDKNIEPGKDFEIEAYLKIIRVHAESLHSEWLKIVEEKKELEVSATAYVNILNYHYALSPISKRLQLSKVKDWLSRKKELRNDFTPLPSSSAIEASLYRNMISIKNDIMHILESRLKKLEPIILIFERGIDAYKESIERKIEHKYEHLKSIATLINIVKEVSNNKLDENWVLSTLALTALENIVNIKLRQLGEDTSGSFTERVSRLKEALIRKENWGEREASDLARRLREKYTGRSIVLHGGYEYPISSEIAQEDMKFIMDIISKIFRIFKE